jgi:hypothetical protein
MLVINVKNEVLLAEKIGSLARIARGEPRPEFLRALSLL